MRYWPIGLVVFGAALLGTQLWPLDADIMRPLMALYILVEVLALGVTAALAAMGAGHGQRTCGRQ